MKIFYTLFLLVFLASCGANTATQVINETTDVPVANIEQDVPSETEEISDIEPDAEPDAPQEESEADAPAEDWGQDAPSEVSNEIDAELETMEKAEETPAEAISEEESDEVSSTEMIELSTTYTNPAMEAVMNIEMSVDDSNIIQSISVTSPNYQGMVSFNWAVQEVVGMSVSEASEFYVSGSSLASPAFQKALKKAL